jgi:hypothetical protein
MMKRITLCTQCGTEMYLIRCTKAFCSDACRKRAARGKRDQYQSRWIIECLRRLGLVARIWPVYSWDQSPPVFSLMVTTHTALDELNFNGISVTEGELDRALRDSSIETANAGERLKAEIRAFYNSRKDRRIQKGTPLPTSARRVTEYAHVFGRFGGRSEEGDT